MATGTSDFATDIINIMFLYFRVLVIKIFLSLVKEHLTYLVDLQMFIIFHTFQDICEQKMAAILDMHISIVRCMTSNQS